LHKCINSLACQNSCFRSYSKILCEMEFIIYCQSLFVIPKISWIFWSRVEWQQVTWAPLMKLMIELNSAGIVTMWQCFLKKNTFSLASTLQIHELWWILQKWKKKILKWKRVKQIHTHNKVVERGNERWIFRAFFTLHKKENFFEYSTKFELHILQWNDLELFFIPKNIYKNFLVEIFLKNEIKTNKVGKGKMSCRLDSKLFVK
jgi:hypothetical protein